MTKIDPGSAAAVNELQDVIALASEQTTDLARARAEAPPETVPISRQRASLGGLVIAAPLLAILIVLNVRDVSVTDLFTPAPAPEVARQQAQSALDGLVSGIDGFREDYHALPDALVQVGIPSQGTWTYTKLTGGGYQVVGRMYGQVVTFNSGERKQNNELKP